jgi:hypothetical protein
MTNEEKINYMRISAGICGFSFKNEHLDLLVSLYELVLKQKGRTKLDDVVSIELDVKKRADIKSKQDILDKISDKKE